MPTPLEVVSDVTLDGAARWPELIGPHFHHGVYPFSYNASHLMARAERFPGRCVEFSTPLQYNFWRKQSVTFAVVLGDPGVAADAHCQYIVRIPNLAGLSYHALPVAVSFPADAGLPDDVSDWRIAWDYSMHNVTGAPEIVSAAVPDGFEVVNSLARPSSRGVIVCPGNYSHAHQPPTTGFAYWGGRWIPRKFRLTMVSFPVYSGYRYRNLRIKLYEVTQTASGWGKRYLTGWIEVTSVERIYTGIAAYLWVTEMDVPNMTPGAPCGRIEWEIEYEEKPPAGSFSWGTSGPGIASYHIGCDEYPRGGPPRPIPHRGGTVCVAVDGIRPTVDPRHSGASWSGSFDVSLDGSGDLSFAEGVAVTNQSDFFPYEYVTNDPAQTEHLWRVIRPSDGAQMVMLSNELMESAAEDALPTWNEPAGWSAFGQLRTRTGRGVWEYYDSGIGDYVTVNYGPIKLPLYNLGPNPQPIVVERIAQTYGIAQPDNGAAEYRYFRTYLGNVALSLAMTHEAQAWTVSIGPGEFRSGLVGVTIGWTFAPALSEFRDQNVTAAGTLRWSLLSDAGEVQASGEVAVTAAGARVCELVGEFIAPTNGGRVAGSLALELDLWVQTGYPLCLPRTYTEADVEGFRITGCWLPSSP